MPQLAYSLYLERIIMPKKQKEAPVFAEGRQAQLVPDPTFHEASPSVAGARLKIGPGGRVVIPADLRQALGVSEGDTLLATMANGELRLLSASGAVRRAQAIVRSVIPVGGSSLVDELLADRRREVERDKERDKERGW